MHETYTACRLIICVQEFPHMPSLYFAGARLCKRGTRTYVHSTQDGKSFDRFTPTGPQRRGREMETSSADMRRRIEALESEVQAARPEDVVRNRKIVVEAMKLYQACKAKYVRFAGKFVRNRVVAQVGVVAGVPTAVVTGGASLVGVAFFGLKLHKSNKNMIKWQELKNRCKAIGEKAAQHADVGFTRTPEGIATFLKPLAGLPEDIYDMLSDIA